MHVNKPSTSFSWVDYKLRWKLSDKMTRVGHSKVIPDSVLCAVADRIASVSCSRRDRGSASRRQGLLDGDLHDEHGGRVPVRAARLADQRGRRRERRTAAEGAERLATAAAAEGRRAVHGEAARRQAAQRLPRTYTGAPWYPAPMPPIPSPRAHCPPWPPAPSPRAPRTPSRCSDTRHFRLSIEWSLLRWKVKVKVVRRKPTK